MNHSDERQIEDVEERLRLAMLNSDLEVLDELIDDNLIFTNHLGAVMSKQDDLEAHRSGVLSIQQLTFSEQQIRILGNAAVVNVKAHIIGSFAGQESENDFRFTRVWSHRESDAWKVIAAHSSLVA